MVSESLLDHLDAVFTFIITSISFAGVIITKFSTVNTRLIKLEVKVDHLEGDCKLFDRKIEKLELKQ